MVTKEDSSGGIFLFFFFFVQKKEKRAAHCLQAYSTLKMVQFDFLLGSPCLQILLLLLFFLFLFSAILFLTSLKKEKTLHWDANRKSSPLKSKILIYQSKSSLWRWLFLPFRPITSWKSTTETQQHQPQEEEGAEPFVLLRVEREKPGTILKNKIKVCLWEPKTAAKCWS